MKVPTKHLPTSLTHLSIVIPAYKEAKTITKTIDRLKKFLDSRQSTYGKTEVIIAVGSSPDDTLSIARNATRNDDNFKIVDAGLPSDKGHNVKVGMSHATGLKQVYMDADLATPLHHLDETMKYLDTYDVVNGQRNLSEIHSEQGHRKLISKLGNTLVRVLLLPGFKDTQCGFKGFRSSLAGTLFKRQSIDRWGFDMEILAIARHQGARIKQLPIKDWQDMEGGEINESKLKAFKAAFMTLADLIKIRYAFSRGRYNQQSTSTRARA